MKNEGDKLYEQWLRENPAWDSRNAFKAGMGVERGEVKKKLWLTGEEVMQMYKRGEIQEGDHLYWTQPPVGSDTLFRFQVNGKLLASYIDNVTTTLFVLQKDLQ